MNMTKQFFFILLASLIIVYFGKEFAALLQILGGWQISLSEKLLGFIPWANRKLIADTCTLILFPFIIALVPAFVYWIVEKKELPHLVNIIWVVWIISVLVFLAHK
jgi:hypothetical protein